MKPLYTKRMLTMIGLAGCGAIVLAAGCSSSSSTQGTEQEQGKTEKKGKISAFVYDRGNVDPSEGSMQKNRWVNWMNEKGPVTVSFISGPQPEAVQKLTTMLAAGDAPDLLVEFNSDFKNYLYNSKQIQPLDDIIDKYSTEYKDLLKQYPILRKISTNADGKMYQFGRVNNQLPNLGLMIRTDWLKKLNLNIPQTTEELYAVSKAFVEQDPDGNGKKDTFGLNMSNPGNGMINYMFQNVGYIVQNGQLVRDWERAEAANAFKKKLYDEGIVDKDYITDKSGQKAQQDWLNGKLGIFMSGLNVDTLKQLKSTDAGAEVAVIPLPKSRYGQFSTSFQPPVQVMGMINAASKNTEDVMKYVDFLIKPDTMTTLSNGLEGTHYKRDAEGCPQPIDLDKNKKELGYSGVTTYGLFTSNVMMKDKCSSNPMYALEHSTDPFLNKEWLKIMKQAKEAYHSSQRPLPTYTHHQYMPSLPKELELITKNTEKSMHIDILQGKSDGEIWVKAIVGGPSYTAEKATQEAKALWEKAGGTQVDDWYKKWYAENKDKAVMTKDIYDLLESQKQR